MHINWGDLVSSFRITKRKQLCPTNLHISFDFIEKKKTKSMPKHWMQLASNPFYQIFRCFLTVHSNWNIVCAMNWNLSLRRFVFKHQLRCCIFRSCCCCCSMWQRWSACVDLLLSSPRISFQCGLFSSFYCTRCTFCVSIILCWFFFFIRTSACTTLKKSFIAAGFDSVSGT